MNATVYDQNNKKVGEIKIPARVFGVRWNPTLVHQALIAQRANSRAHRAHTKDRSEVRGGGKKPWAQKHTGRSRHGSIRSPLWKGGGVTFGPRTERDFSKKINKKMKRLALYSVLSKKFSDNNIKIIESLAFTEPKTKYAVAMLKNFFPKKANVLFVPQDGSSATIRAARNIPHVAVRRPASLNVYECLNHEFIFFDRAAIDEMSTAQVTK